MKSPILKIVSVDGKFQIQDEKAGVYGTHSTQQKAPEIMADWQKYFEDCADTEEEA